MSTDNSAPRWDKAMRAGKNPHMQIAAAIADLASQVARTVDTKHRHPVDPEGREGLLTDQAQHPDVPSTNPMPPPYATDWQKEAERYQKLYVEVLAKKSEFRAVLHRCWADLATEHERNHPLPEHLQHAMLSAWHALGQPGAKKDRT